MAGQRRAQYVSIPMGPGVLSNTTGRGAKSRVAYMNWDRWKDSTWVRWHKLLPEKQGGWQYQSLNSSSGQQLAPGSPVLLLHFDGTNGQTTTVDSSIDNNPMTLQNVSGGSGSMLSTTPASPVGNTAVFNSGIGTPNTGNICTTPVTQGSPLDMSNEASWTIEFWWQCGLIGAFTQQFMVIGKQTNSSSGFNGISFQSSGSNSNEIEFEIYGATSSNGQRPSYSGVVANTWYHIALVKRPDPGGSGYDQYQMFVNGVGQGWTGTSPGYQGPYTSWAGFAVLNGYWSAYYSSFNATTWETAWSEVRFTPNVALYQQNFTPPTVPNTLGLPNTLGTANPPNNYTAAQYLGLCRDLHDWSSIDGQYWIALGTHLKLYVVNQGTLYDITPDRKTSNLTNPLSVVSASNVVTVIDENHQANTGDFVDLTGGTAIGGLTLTGDYEISVIDPNTYSFLAASNATSTVSGGGGNVSINYEISTGLPSNGQLLGYGTGPYGEGTYGTPRPVGSGVPARLRTWSLDNYGQDLIASYSDGEIYWWQKDNGPNSPAALLTNAPVNCQRVLVDAAQRVIIALGCTDVTSAYDAMLVRWCSLDDITDWFPTDENTAGDELLTAGSRIVTGLKTKGQNLIFTDTDLYRMQYVGEPDIYDFYPAGKVSIVGPNAAVDVDGVAYFWGFDNFYNYSGTLNLQACEVWETVLDPNVPTSLLRSQSEKVTCFTYETKTEITWLYPSIGGVQTLTFTNSIAQWATSATLASAWTGATGQYPCTFSDQEAAEVTLTNGATTCTWPNPLTQAASSTATLGGECDRYVTYNWEDGTWYCGAWNRTCAMGRAPAMGGYPYGVNGGYLYQHEIGTDAVEPSGTVAIGFYMKSLDITTGGAKSEYTMGGSDARFAIGGSDSGLLVRSMLPDWAYFTGTMNITISTKDRPQDANYVVNGPVAFTAATGQIDIDANGSQLVIQFDNYTAAGGAPSLGCSFRMGIIQGLAVPYVKR